MILHALNLVEGAIKDAYSNMVGHTVSGRIFKSTDIHTELNEFLVKK
jgi:hypothetical protein